MKQSLYILLFLASWFSLGALATEESVTSQCLSRLYKLQNPTQDTSIELEMAADPEVLSLFTTSNGVLGDFFPGEPIPASLLRRFDLESEEEVRRIPWAQLSLGKRQGVLQISAQQKKTPFFEDRRAPHLQYVDNITLYTDKSHSFLGRDLTPGRQALRPKDFLKGPIEYIGPDNDPWGFELHFRTNLPAGEVSRSARTFQELLRVPKTHQHAYVVVPIPQKALEQDPELIAFQNADYFRRANLAAEMMSVVEENQSITKRESLNGGMPIRWFGWLSAADLKTVYRYLLARGKHKDFSLGDQVKIAWVGFRGHDKFDQPDLMGMEVRAISRYSNMDIIEPFLNTLQKSWTEQELGLPLSHLKSYLETQYAGDASLALQENWYHRDWSQVIAHASPRVQEYFSNWGLPERALFYEAAPEETKMLFHDWSKDPLLMGSATKRHFILREQALALEKLKQGGTPYRKVVREFLIKSGLYERVLRSLKPMTIDSIPAE